MYDQGRYEDSVGYLQYALQLDPALWQAYRYRERRSTPWAAPRRPSGLMSASWRCTPTPRPRNGSRLSRRPSVRPLAAAAGASGRTQAGASGDGCPRAGAFARGFRSMGRPVELQSDGLLTPRRPGRSRFDWARFGARAGVEWTFAPTLAVVRDIRWGRTYESFSEDPGAGRVVRRAATCAACRATLGDDGVIACAKHWVGDGGTTGGIDQGDTGDRRGRARPAPTSRPTCRRSQAGVLTVMASFNSWNREKCHGQPLPAHRRAQGAARLRWLRRLRLGRRRLALRRPTPRRSRIAVNAGVDMIMVSAEWRRMLRTLKAASSPTAACPMARIDDAVRRILSVKLATGSSSASAPGRAALVEQPDRFGGAAHREVAREAVRKSLVLLKNEGGAPAADRRRSHPRRRQERGQPRAPVRRLHRRVAGHVTATTAIHRRHVDLGGHPRRRARRDAQRRRHRGRRGRA